MEWILFFFFPQMSAKMKGIHGLRSIFHLFENLAKLPLLSLVPEEQVGASLQP